MDEIMQCEITDLLFSIKAGLDELELLYAVKTNAILNDYTFTEMHCIDNIHRIPNANVTKISNAMNITKGGISKIIKRLVKRRAIEIYTSQMNRKEIYYRLTDLGEQVFSAHETMHKNWYKQDNEFFRTFKSEEIQQVCQILSQYNNRLKEQLSNLEGDL